MSDDYNISYSFQVDPAPAAPRADNRLIAFTSCEAVNLGSAVLLLNRDNGRQMTVAPEVATALTYCTTFRTLQDHAQMLVTTIPQLNGQLADVTKVLETVDGAGLMLESDTILERLNPQPLPQPALAPTRVFIISCDRPAAVERLLDSMLRSARLGCHDELFLVDDSRDAANREQNRELVARFNRGSARNMAYVGVAAQRRIMDELIAAQPDEERAIRFLLERERWAKHKSYGLARTLCLLLSVGYRCIVLDDDVLCRSVRPPDQAQGISFGGGSNRELASFASEQALLQQASYRDTDPLSEHARCLGMNLAPAIVELHGDALGQDSLHEANAALLNTLQADSPILVTQCGSWGDPGVPGSNWFTHLGTESLQRAAATPGGLSAAMHNRHYWLGRSRPNISKMAVMSQATGLDNTHLLPPYFPAFRGEDYLFASMLLYLHPGSAVLDYDWCVPHLPLEQRSAGGQDSPALPRGGLPLCARYLSDRVDYDQGIPPETRLQKLALLLRELAQSKPAGLLATFRTELARQQADELQQLSTQLQNAPTLGDGGWEEFLRRSHEQLTTALQSPASPLDIPGVPAGLGEEALLRQIQAGIDEFGQALAAWPGMRDTAAAVTRQMLDAGDLTP